MSKNKKKADIVREVSLESRVSEYLKNKISIFIYGIAALLVLMFIVITAKNYFESRDDKFLNIYYSQLQLYSMNTTGISLDMLVEEAKSRKDYTDYLLFELSGYAKSSEEQIQLLEELEGDFKQLAQSRLYDIKNMNETVSGLEKESSMIPEIWEYRAILSEIGDGSNKDLTALTNSINSFIDKYNSSYMTNNIYIWGTVF